ncbi:UDP-N-acetylglucosamine transferase subunit alg13 [Penicillium macrosclerotiorum]|uniref:UDP-N-acetylglucosamine transferase subunit alg13 n=1 Tax=Penicillium macrosclerotiorum TaxID=303699 RepID=UPI002549BDA1|nr:UDP-N-acetylglucosamine transferase subunit alg13 [Penicillium macrosclerotiorum]KAJ5679638.1 UDP-N-acetylglucosamine transferase subunit alg13 [Penicillium macrosclerotiorum]
MKLCFVTVGATASFEKLVQEVLHDPFLAELKKYKFTHLIVQYGKNGQSIFDKFTSEHLPGTNSLLGMDVAGFDFKPDLTTYFQMAQKNPSKSQELGLIISHAGTGSILAALRAGLPLIVVPNPDLADNHQEELALELANYGYAVKGSLENIPSTVSLAEIRREQAPYYLDTDERNLGAPLSDQLSYLD